MSDLEKRIIEIPSDGEWWRKGNFDAFVALAKELIAKGFTEDEAVRFLDDCYSTVANEFGG